MSQPPAPAHDKLSLADYEALLAQPTEADRLLEWLDGGLIETMPSYLHSHLIHLLSGYLFMYLLQKPIGQALIEARYRLPEQQASLIPDLSFIRAERLPVADPHGPLPFAPDLAVEVRSEGQSAKFMLDKAQRYLAAGTRMVWLVYADKQLVEVLTPSERHLLLPDEALQGGEVLPDFRLPLRQLFPLPPA
jgi:Uma2 family endonuclease